jgi:hypothetical protein
MTRTNSTLATHIAAEKTSRRLNRHTVQLSVEHDRGAGQRRVGRDRASVKPCNLDGNDGVGYIGQANYFRHQVAIHAVALRAQRQVSQSRRPVAGPAVDFARLVTLPALNQTDIEIE